jgi:hypothetical protein
MVEDIYVGNSCVESESTLYMGRLPRPTYWTSPVAYAAPLPWPPHRTATSASPGAAWSRVTAWHARTKRKTGGKVIDTYYSEHIKFNVIDTQRITHHAPCQSQQRDQNAGKIPSAAMIAR